MIDFAGEKNGLKAAKATFKIIIMISIFCIACVITYFLNLLLSGDDEGNFTAVSHTENAVNLPIVVIDAGHGGIDGGTIAPDGGTEKELNLDLSKRLYSLFKFSGIDCIMTRWDDKMLADESMKSHRKMTDLKNRLIKVSEIAETGRDVLLVSIHMNNFHISKYSGLQVWYSSYDERSKSIAEQIQADTKVWLDEDNNRAVKKADSSIYLLDRATFPAVLIECGFLSNPEEYKLLSTPEYRNKLASTIYTSICKEICGT